jgi:hypothetical protein
MTVYNVHYVNGRGEASWTVLPLRTKGVKRKLQVLRAMARIFGPHFQRIIEIGVARA